MGLAQILALAWNWLGTCLELVLIWQIGVGFMFQGGLEGSGVRVRAFLLLPPTSQENSHQHFLLGRAGGQAGWRLIYHARAPGFPDTLALPAFPSLCPDQESITGSLPAPKPHRGALMDYITFSDAD